MEPTGKTYEKREHAMKLQNVLKTATKVLYVLPAGHGYGNSDAEAGFERPGNGTEYLRLLCTYGPDLLEAS